MVQKQERKLPNIKFYAENSRIKQSQNCQNLFLLEVSRIGTKLPKCPPPTITTVGVPRAILRWAGPVSLQMVQTAFLRIFINSGRRVFPVGRLCFHRCQIFPGGRRRVLRDLLL